MDIYFEIPGKPFGKQRPRVINRGGFAKAYTPKETVSYENLVKMCYRQDVKEMFDSDAQIEVLITAYYDIPKSTSKKKKDLMLNGKIRPTVKPDCDNICKIILDALNGVAYHDDKQVVTVHVTKWYAETPSVRVCLFGLYGTKDIEQKKAKSEDEL